MANPLTLIDDGKYYFTYSEWQDVCQLTRADEICDIISALLDQIYVAEIRRIFWCAPLYIFQTLSCIDTKQIRGVTPVEKV